MEVMDTTQFLMKFTLFLSSSDSKTPDSSYNI